MTEHSVEKDALAGYLLEADQGHLEVTHEPCGEHLLLTLRVHLDTLVRIAAEHACPIPPGADLIGTCPDITDEDNPREWSPYSDPESQND